MSTLIEQSKEAFSYFVTDWPRNPSVREATDRAKELEAACLTRQASVMRYEAKRDLLSISGFSKMTLEQAVGEVMGEPPSERFSPDFREIGRSLMPLEWSAFYGTRYLRPAAFRRFNDKNALLFFRTTKWVCLAGTLAALKTPPPRGVTLFLRDLQAAKTFDFFTVVAPQEMFLSPQEIDPLLLGGICAAPSDAAIDAGSPSPEALYFAIARWDKS